MRACLRVRARECPRRQMRVMNDADDQYDDENGDDDGDDDNADDNDDGSGSGRMHMSI